LSPLSFTSARSKQCGSPGEAACSCGERGGSPGAGHGRVSAAPQAPRWHLPPRFHGRGNITLLAATARLSKPNTSPPASRRWGERGAAPGQSCKAGSRRGRAAGPVPARCHPAVVPSGSASATYPSGRCFTPVHCQVLLGFSPLGTRLQFFGSAGEEARRALVVFIRVKKGALKQTFLRVPSRVCTSRLCQHSQAAKSSRRPIRSQLQRAGVARQPNPSSLSKPVGLQQCRGFCCSPQPSRRHWGSSGCK